MPEEEAPLATTYVVRPYAGERTILRVVSFCRTYAHHARALVGDALAAAVGLAVVRRLSGG